MRLARGVNMVGWDLILFFNFFWSRLGPGGKDLLQIPGKKCSRRGGEMVASLHTWVLVQQEDWKPKGYLFPHHRLYPHIDFSYLISEY